MIFTSRAALAGLYPRLLDHAAVNFSAKDILTFLGRKLHPRFEGEVLTSCQKARWPGARIKHRMKNNWLKWNDRRFQGASSPKRGGGAFVEAVARARTDQESAPQSPLARELPGTSSARSRAAPVSSWNPSSPQCCGIDNRKDARTTRRCCGVRGRDNSNKRGRSPSRPGA